jgi:hypothetical protein
MKQKKWALCPPPPKLVLWSQDRRRLLQPYCRGELGLLPSDVEAVKVIYYPLLAYIGRYVLFQSEYECRLNFTSGQFAEDFFLHWTYATHVSCHRRRKSWTTNSAESLTDAMVRQVDPSSTQLKSILWRPCNFTPTHSLTGPMGQPFASRLGGQQFVSRGCPHSHNGTRFLL